MFSHILGAVHYRRTVSSLAYQYYTKAGAARHSICSVLLSQASVSRKVGGHGHGQAQCFSFFGFCQLLFVAMPDRDRVQYLIIFDTHFSCFHRQAESWS